jgi:inositol oxygenase
MEQTVTAQTNGIDLAVVDELEEFQKARYEERDAAEALAPDAKAKEAYRDYEAEARATVKEFYRLNHQHQTFEFVQAKKAEYLPRTRTTMGIWEAMEFLNTLVDDSDPDTDLTQIEHLLQTAEAIRADGHPRWFILTGLIHDLGKILCLWGEPQWAVVGDTFPVGCAYSDKIVFPEFFALNPDRENPAYQTPEGIYEPGAGLDTVHLSWGHDEYLYQVVRDHLPEESLFMIRYHSFYAAHREGAYAHLMSERDREMFRWVRAFNPYDLYSKTPVRPDVAALKPYYQDLIAEYFPPTLHW